MADLDGIRPGWFYADSFLLELPELPVLDVAVDVPDFSVEPDLLSVEVPLLAWLSFCAAAR
jgi:hypothetical protein